MKIPHENIENYSLVRLPNLILRTWRKAKPEKRQRALELSAHLKRDIGIDTVESRPGK